MSNAVAKRRERERAARRDTILDAAQQVFWRKGFDATKMGDIAEAAQLGKGTLYLYFRDKDHLALGLAARHQDKLLRLFDAARTEADSGLSLLHALLTAYADHMKTPVEHLRMVMARWASGEPFDPDSEGCQRARANVAKIFGTMAEAVARAQAEGDMRADRSPERIAAFLWSSVNGALLVKLQLSCVAPPSLLREAVVDTDEHIQMLLDGCRGMAARTSHVGHAEAGE